MDWQTTVSTAQVVYSGKLPLQPGGHYLLMVKTEKGVSSMAEPLAKTGLEFSILPAERAKRVRAEVAAIAQQPWPPDSKALALAQLYVRYGLIADAIDTLEASASQGSQTAAIYRHLGALYLHHLGLVPHAKPAYEQALALADDHDLDTRTAAQEGLGQIQAALGNPAAARHWLTQALAGYRHLGDRERVQTLEQHLQQLNP